MQQLFDILGMDDIEIISVSGNPLPKERPRKGKEKVYTPKKTIDAEKALAMHMRLQLSKREGNIGVVGMFYRSTAHVVDSDNLMKLLLDAGNRSGVWDDDCQVTLQLGIVGLDRENPRTIIAIGSHRSTMPR